MKKKKEYCSVTRNTDSDYVEIWPAHVGIRKFHGCVCYGAAWEGRWRTFCLYESRGIVSSGLNKKQCCEGTAWFIDGKKRTKVDIAFSP